MDERENTQPTLSDTIKRKNPLLIAATLLAALALIGLGILIYATFRPHQGKGYQNYTIQKEQYYVEYSEHFDYWDVLTIEYPQIEGIDEALQEQMNTAMYDVAMDRARYWHLIPNEEVSAFQKENFSIYCSDVNCDVNYHSQYLVSINYQEYYSIGNPVSMTRYTERALNIDLETGEVYGLKDILTIDEDFIKLLCQSINEEQGWELFPDDEESVEILLSWFHNKDEELEEVYEFCPYFYLTEDKNFVIGLSVNPLPKGVTASAPENDTYCAYMEAESLEPYQTDSVFWEKYDKSQMAGEVLPCLDKKQNRWLGEEAGVWDYWEER